MRLVEQRIVPASVLEDLPQGIGWLRVPPIQRKRARVEPAAMALPETLPCKLPAPGDSGDTKGTAGVGDSGTHHDSAVPAAAQSPCSSAPPDPRIARYSEQVGEHWVWRKPSMVNSTGYPRLKIKGKYESVHKWWWEQLHGPVPEGMTLHHTCDVLYGKLCVWPGCMALVTRERNTELRWERDQLGDA